MKGSVKENSEETKMKKQDEKVDKKEKNEIEIEKEESKKFEKVKGKSKKVKYGGIQKEKMDPTSWYGISFSNSHIFLYYFCFCQY